MRRDVIILSVAAACTAYAVMGGLPSDPAVMDVEWRAVSHNEPSLSMPRSVPWVHGLIQGAQGPSPRIELAPKRREGDHYPVHLIVAHPDQAAAETMGWDETYALTVDGYAVEAMKALGPAAGWADPEPWALVAELDADHPLVVHAAAQAAGPQAAMAQAETDYYAAARDWVGANFPHPDAMNVVRRLTYEAWNGRADYWPGDPLPDVEAVCEQARNELSGGGD